MWKAWTHETTCKAKQTAVGCQKTTFKGQREEKKEKGRRTYLVREEESNEREDALDINSIYSVFHIKRPYHAECEGKRHGSGL